MKRWILAFALLLPSQAFPQTYLGASVTRVTYSEPGFPSLNPVAVALRAGNQFNDHFALEGRFGFGIADDTADITLEVDNFFGVYARGILPLNPQLSIYGIVGYTDGEVTASIPGLSVSDSDDDFSYGIGIEASVAPKVIISGEYMKLFDKPDYYINTLSFGIGFKF